MIDYAEDYTFEIQNEVQSMHWHSYQITIFVQITWHRHFSTTDAHNGSKFFMKYNLYVSDNKTHDNFFVQHCLTLHWENLKSTG